MTFELVGELIVLFFLALTWGAEIVRDLRFYAVNGFNLNEQREANIFNGFIVKAGKSTTAKSRFFFWYPLVTALCVIIALDIFGYL